VLTGSLVSGAGLETVNEGVCFALVDGNNGSGPVIATRGMNHATEKVLLQGLGSTVIRNANDLGMSGQLYDAGGCPRLDRHCYDSWRSKGGAMTRGAKTKRPWNAGQFFLAIHIKSCVPADSFEDAIDEFIADIKSCRPGPGFSEIKMPGERGCRPDGGQKPGRWC
jgi:LDH2 family malate/lactate/ureidoglycolate dehydrogenase